MHKLSYGVPVAGDANVCARNTEYYIILHWVLINYQEERLV